MNDQELTTLEQVRCFLEGTEALAFEIRRKDESYAWIERTLLRFRNRRPGRAEKGLLVRYLMKVSGYSRQQITRLIGQYREDGRIRRRQRTVNGFARRYTAEDSRLLAEPDTLHGTLSGPATKKLLKFGPCWPPSLHLEVSLVEIAVHFCSDETRPKWFRFGSENEFSMQSGTF